jgi:hypothetical protein
MAARALIIVGVALVVGTLAKALPRDNLVRLRLESSLGPVTRMDLTWTQVGEDGASGGASLRFESKAPKLVEHPVVVQNGDYWLEVVLYRGGPRPEARSMASYRRRLRFNGGETTVFLSSKRPGQAQRP